MPRWMNVCCAGWLLLVGGAATARADGGTLRACEQCGQCRITVFTSPAPLRAGPVDVSVLVQDAASGEIVRGARIEVRARPRGRPDATIRQRATAAAATNKLFQAASLNLPSAGNWEIRVALEGPAARGQLQFSVAVDEPLPQWASMWPWFTWPLLIVLLFAGRECFAQHLGRAGHRRTEDPGFGAKLDKRRKN